MPKCSKCEATEATSGGVVNLGAYAGAAENWLCPSHLPPDWPGHPSARMFPHEMLVMKAFVERQETSK